MSNPIPLTQEAPEAGVWVLGYNPQYEPTEWRIVRLAFDGYWEAADAYDEFLGCYHSAKRIPTHWMPLPARL